MSAAMGKRQKMISSLFFQIWFAPKEFGANQKKKREIGCVVALTQGGGLSGLALGYYFAAPAGAPELRRATTRLTGGHMSEERFRGFGIV